MFGALFEASYNVPSDTRWMVTRRYPSDMPGVAHTGFLARGLVMGKELLETLRAVYVWFFLVACLAWFVVLKLQSAERRKEQPCVDDVGFGKRIVLAF